MTESRIDDLLDELVPPFSSSADSWDDVLARVRVNRSRYTVLAVAALALLLVPTAVALRGRISDLFQGAPAPPAVTTSFEGNNKIADLATQKGFGGKFPRVDVSRIRGVLEIQTPDGPQDVWAAPNDQGGTCWYVDWANDPAPNGVQPGYGTCDTGPRTGSIGTSYWWELPHSTLKTLFALVDVRADRAIVELKDGSSRTVPVVEGALLASFDQDAQLARITAHDGNDRVATWEAPVR
jgi:hypothetical protein